MAAWSLHAVTQMLVPETMYLPAAQEVQALLPGPLQEAQKGSHCLHVEVDASRKKLAAWSVQSDTQIVVLSTGYLLAAHEEHSSFPAPVHVAQSASHSLQVEEAASR